MRPFSRPSHWLLTAALAFVPVALLADRNGWLGYALGVVGSGGSMYGTWAAIRMISGPEKGSAAPRFGTLILLLAVLVKMPIIVATILIAIRMGGSATTCYLWGLAVVYFSTVGWALASS